MAAVLALPFLTAACQPEPRAIVYGQDIGDYCRMTIMDEGYGAELVTRTGKTYVFDSIECLASFYLEEQVPHEEVHSMWVTDFQDPPTLIPVEEAFYLHSRDLPSPMGMNLTAFSDAIRRDAVTNSFYGELLDWQGVLDLVRTERPHGAMHDAAPGDDTGARPMPAHGDTAGGDG